MNDKRNEFDFDVVSFPFSDRTFPDVLQVAQRNVPIVARARHRRPFLTGLHLPLMGLHFRSYSI